MQSVFYIKVYLCVRYLLTILVDCCCASSHENIIYGKACCIINCVGGFKVPYGYSTHALYFGSVLGDFQDAIIFQLQLYLSIILPHIFLYFNYEYKA